MLQIFFDFRACIIAMPANSNEKTAKEVAFRKPLAFEAEKRKGNEYYAR